MVNDYKKFDIVLVNFGDVEFFGEQAGIRPAVIVQNQIGNMCSPCTIVMPMTTKIKHLNQSTHSLFGKNKGNGLKEDSMLLGECVRQISEKRIIKKLGSITNLSEKNEIGRVCKAIFED